MMRCQKHFGPKLQKSLSGSVPKDRSRSVNLDVVMSKGPAICSVMLF